MNIAAHHPAEDILAEYLRNGLPLSTALVVSGHLLLCSPCREKADELDFFAEQIRRAHAGPKPLDCATHLPLYSLEAAAGGFSKPQIVAQPDCWIPVRSSTTLRLTPDMYVIHVKGISMEPTIRNGSLCVFTGKMEASCDGKVVLLEQYGNSGKGGNRYTVKIYHASSQPDPNEEGEDL